MRATFVRPDGQAVELDVEPGVSMMRAAVLAGVDGIVGECGGQAMCATCHVYVREEHLADLPPLGDDEDEMLESTAAERTGRSRLSCQLKDLGIGRIVVDVPETQL